MSEEIKAHTRIQKVLIQPLSWFLVASVLLLTLLACHFFFKPELGFWADLFHVLSSILIGLFVSFVLYFLVVFLPERRRYRIAKLYFKDTYRDIKEDILEIIVRGSTEGSTYDPQEIQDLMNPSNFKAAFKGEKGGRERFYVFVNYITTNEAAFRELKFHISLLVKQIGYILYNYNIENEESFVFLKNIEIYLLRLPLWGIGSDEYKEYIALIMEIYAGWNLMHGDRGYDAIEKVIDDM